MCGRFTQISSSAEIARVFNLAHVPQLEPRYNIAPTQKVAGILRSDPESDREFKWLRWGLIPHWAKEQSIGNKLINARAETVAQPDRTTTRVVATTLAALRLRQT